MLKRRIIACLDVRDGVVVKGTKFRGHEVMGGVVELAARYRDEGADELVLYDITASSEGRRVDTAWVSAVAKVLDIPFCVAGGIRSIDDARAVLTAGADKISVNSPALERPELIAELAEAFGSQCVVVGIDSRFEGDSYGVYQYTGSESTTRATRRDALAWAEEVVRLGAGEIVLNCMDADGTRSGFDLPQLQLLRQRVRVPLIASGGAGSAEDFLRVFQATSVDGALAAGVFHRREVLIPDLKHYLSLEGIQVRPC